MSSKKALFVGCSFTADCGFSPENQPKYHWPHLFCQHTGYNLVNLAIGGMSNQEIFLRTTEAITKNTYDLVVVMWSDISRHWAYCSDNNVDDFTILNSGIASGFQSDLEFTKTYAKMHYTYFDNKYVNTKNWLLYCIALGNLLENKNIQYIFARGFHNYIDRFVNAKYDADGFTNIDVLKGFLDFDNRPDDYILKKITGIQDLINIQGQSKWVNLFSNSFKDMIIDLSDDHMHPGPKTNAEFSSKLINFYEQSI